MPGRESGDVEATATPLHVEHADDGVTVLTLDRPDVLNSLDAALKRELREALAGIARDASVRAVVLTGAGRAFCAGQDLSEGGRGGGGRGAAPLDYPTLLRRDYIPIVLGIRRLAKPVVAAVNGVAAGAGFSLALACDLRIASEAASFAAAFGRVGLVPDSGMSWFLPRLVGSARATEIVLAGEAVDAATAERIGLVQRVVPLDRLMPTAIELASRLAAASPVALGLTKRALDRSLESDLEAALEYEAQLQGIAGRSRDHAEGLAAFREKRAPRFTGD